VAKDGSFISAGQEAEVERFAAFAACGGALRFAKNT